MTKDELKELLAQEPVSITFVKVDGTLRTMLATTSEDHVPVQQDARTEMRYAKRGDGAYAVWDIESNGWRSFRWSSIQRVNEEPTTISG